MPRPTPLGALARGFVAGVAGARTQTEFFARTKRFTPSPPEDAFDPPEPEQRSETSTQTVARRTVELWMQRGPLTPEQKELGGQVVHYGFGGLWGGLYGLARESAPVLATPGGAAAWSLGVWMIADNLILPVFRLAGWPQRYPLRSHAYAIAAHLAYGAGLAGSYEAMHPRTVAALQRSLFTLGARWWLSRKLPRRLRGAARPLARSASAVRSGGGAVREGVSTLIH